MRMERIPDSSNVPLSPSWRLRDVADRARPPAVLVVDDDSDIREMMATLLDLTGFLPVCCASADAALEALRTQRFDVVLTDYALPVHSGVWMLQRAEAEGLIDDVPVLMVTAHSNPPGASAYEIVRKPFDLDDLVARIERRLQHHRGMSLPKASAPIGRAGALGSDGDGRHQACPDLELILYVSGPPSGTELDEVRRILSQLRSPQLKVTICDGSCDPGLERTQPGPRTILLGHIQNLNMLLELVDECDEKLAGDAVRQAPSRTANTAAIESRAPASSRRSRAKQKRT